MTSEQKDRLIMELMDEIAELKRRLGLHSANSSKPPSSDGLGKPNAAKRTQSSREKTGRRKGGQPGHEGTHLAMSASPDHFVEHAPQESFCPNCRSSWAEASLGLVLRAQVHELPPPKLEVTEHQVYGRTCTCCGHSVMGTLPEGVESGAQYGPRVRAVGLYLQHAQLLPYERTAQTCAELFGIHLSEGSLENFGAQAHAALGGFEEQAREALATAPSKHMDETGVRIGGRTQWLHVLCNPRWTHYDMRPKRQVNTEGLRGTVVHDHLRSYYTQSAGQSDLRHGACAAHILRELRAVAEVDGEGWAAPLRGVLQRAIKLKHASADGVVPEPGRAGISAGYDRLVKQGIRHHEGLAPLRQGARGRRARRPGHNLAVRLRDFKEDTLRFMSEAEVAPTNNLAERDLRMMKVKQKISGSFRSEEGARRFARIRSYVSTVRKQELKLWDSLAAIFTSQLPALC